MTNKEKTGLPVVENDGVVLLPTGKEHVSFSEMFDWIECSWKHKLKHIEKLSDSGPSIHTEYGQVIHDAMEEYIMQPMDDRKPLEPSKYVNQFVELLKPIKEAQSKKVVDSNQDEEEVAALTKLLEEESEFIEAIPKILEQAPKWLDKQFPGWEPVFAEYQINEPYNGARFKGFIDAVIKVPTETPGVYRYKIIDYKTTGSGWYPSQKKDFNKQLQLILYKYFFCKIQNIDYDDVECSFVLLKRTPDKEGVLCEEIVVPSNSKHIDKAMGLLTNFVNQIRQKLATKNKSPYNCRFCAFKHTEHCT